jgi:tetraacyldisaccharide 4'-kinase
MKAALSRLLDELWYGRHPSALVLLPLSLGYQAAIRVRRFAYTSGLLNIAQPTIPVLVVGNLTVGGTGKTPLVIWIAAFLREAGFKPGIITRGYGGQAKHWPQQVRADSDPHTVGDEAIVLARRSRCPVAAGPDRAASVGALVAHAGCDIAISDDGLQHYGIARAVEIVVVDGVRRFGNGLCLPAGPLREPVSRLAEVDFVVTNGIAGRSEFSMKYVGTTLYGVADRARSQPLETFSGQAVHAVAGIANPDRYFTMLRSKGLRVTPHAFPDHHPFTARDLAFADDLPIIMTEKDAVKCETFASDRHWFLPITAELPELFGQRLLQLLQRGRDGQETA